MKIVKLTRDMRPWRAGDDAVLPDELAEKLLKLGEAQDPRPYPPSDVAPAAPRETLSLKKKPGYFTRKKD
jgi:hypothetical protein